MYRLLGWRGDRRGCGRRRVGVAVLRLWLSRVQLWLRLPGVQLWLWLPGVQLRPTLRILWRLLRSAPLLRAPLLSLLIGPYGSGSHSSLGRTTSSTAGLHRF